MATLLSFFLYPEHYSFSGSHAFNGWLIAMPMIFTALTAGHFMSQILAEQLRNNRKTAAPPTGGPLRSFVNLHMDAGTLCWIYIFLGFGPLFVVVYAPVSYTHLVEASTTTKPEKGRPFTVVK